MRLDVLNIYTIIISFLPKTNHNVWSQYRRPLKKGLDIWTKSHSKQSFNSQVLALSAGIDWGSPVQGTTEPIMVLNSQNEKFSGFLLLAQIEARIDAVDRLKNKIDDLLIKYK